VFAPDGRPLAALAGLDPVRALAFLKDGTLAVAEGARVTRFELARRDTAPAGME
jgi:hypothetical protein